MDYLQPLIIGLVGSFHCIGMCGPLALSLPLKEQSLTTRITSAMLYNSGRIFTYGFLGLLLGFLGFGFSMWGIQQWISIAMGALMIFSVGFPLMFKQTTFITGLFDRLYKALTTAFGRFFGVRTYGSVLIIGLLNGFLPCGLVYIALAGALLVSTPVNGAIYMIIFGLGTLPALLATSVAGTFLKATFRTSVRKLMPYIVLTIGILFVLRGMNLGIPYLSPKMEPVVQKTEQFQKPACCHEE